MEIPNALANYGKRVSIIAPYFLLSKFVFNRQMFKVFENDEFYNLLVQTLCFIYQRSLGRKKCFKGDIKEFLQEMNHLAYKKTLTLEELEDLTGYVIKALTNDGKEFNFPYYCYEEDKIITQNVRFVEVEVFTQNKETKLSYRLTNDGYRLLLSTKEYDELYQIHISQTLARLRLEHEDYVGAINEIQEIINIFEIQKQKINRFIKELHQNTNFLKTNSSVDVIDQTLQVLKEEMKKYEELKQEALIKLQDKENLLNGKGNLMKDKLDVIEKKLRQLKEFIDGIDDAKSAASRLITHIQGFEMEHSEFIKRLLRTSVLEQFDFKEEILERLEKKPEQFEKMLSLMSSLFKPTPIQLLNINTAYAEQVILREVEEEKLTQNEGDYIAVEDTSEFERLKKYDVIYYAFFQMLMRYGTEKLEFTLKDFLSYCIKNEQLAYIKMTQDCFVFRNILMYFSEVGAGVDLKLLLTDIESKDFFMDFEFQIERMLMLLNKEDGALAHTFTLITSETIIDEEFEIKTEIDIDELKSRNIKAANISFEFSID